MRFKTSIRNISTFTSQSPSILLFGGVNRQFLELTSCLTSIGKIAWLRLDEDEIRFTLMPEQGVQVFAYASPALHISYNQLTTPAISQSSVYLSSGPTTPINIS
jgi:hypothetical protein